MDKNQLRAQFELFLENISKGPDNSRMFTIDYIKPNDLAASEGYDQYRYKFMTSKQEDHCANILIEKSLSDVEYLERHIVIIKSLIDKIGKE